MATIANLAVSLTANTKNFQTGLQKATKGLFSMRSAIGGLVGGAGIGALVQSNLDAADRIQKLAIQTQASTEFLSEMRGVAQLAGVEFESLARSIPKMQKAIVEANDGTEAYADAFEKLGINTAEFIALAPDEQFTILADRIGGIQNAAERSEVAMAIFGRTGAELNQVFEGGAAALNNMREQVRATGQSLSRDQVDAAAAANDAMTLLKGTFAGIATDLSINFAPQITRIANGLRTVLVPAVDVVTRAFEGLGSLIGGTMAIIGQLAQGNFRNAFNIGVDVAGDIRALLNEPLRQSTTAGGQEEQKTTNRLLEENNRKQDELVRAVRQPRLAVAG